MGFVFDIIIAAFFIFIVYNGYKSGLFRCLMNFAAYIISFFTARYLSGWVADYLYESFTKQYFITSALNEIAEITGSIADAIDFNKLINDNSIAFNDILKKYGINLDFVAEMFESGLQKGVDNINHFTAEKIVEPFSKDLTYAIAFIAVFAGTLLILRIVILIADNFLQLPVLNALNRFGGVAAGVVSGFIFSCILALILIKLTPYFMNLTKDATIDDFLKTSFVFKFFYDYFVGEMHLFLL